MNRTRQPKYIFESSWEVCNKVGGIYTVLSTHAKTLTDAYKNKLIFVGPDLWIDKDNPLFKENKRLLSTWKLAAKSEGLNIRIGRWNIPGNPIAVLVDYVPFYEHKNDIYRWAWDNFQVDSYHAYGDYDEANMFSYAAAKVVESYYSFHNLTVNDNVIYHAHEWMTCLGALYLKKSLPDIATVFTTHATSIGRSIAGNEKPLYDYLWAYNGDQMALELNMQSKHSLEKQTAHAVDAFTTVSDITAEECMSLLEKRPDAVLTNGFENNFVPAEGKQFNDARKKARARLLQVANALLGSNLDDQTIIVSTGGRYEYKNKGIDLFVDAINRLRHDERLERDVLVLINVPAWTKGPRPDLQERLQKNKQYDSSCGDSRITHLIYNYDQDKILNQMNWLDMHNRGNDHVKVIYVPCYLQGDDGIFNMSYYDLLIGNDICVYPSYYEPWGYTPLESVAFHIPCVTTDLAGFGLWVKGLMPENYKKDGLNAVSVLHRTDNNFVEVAEEIKDILLIFSKLNQRKINKLRNEASEIASKALWSEFIENYYDAYNKALNKRDSRIHKHENKYIVPGRVI